MWLERAPNRKSTCASFSTSRLKGVAVGRRAVSTILSALLDYELGNQDADQGADVLANIRERLAKFPGVPSSIMQPPSLVVAAFLALASGTNSGRQKRGHVLRGEQT